VAERPNHVLVLDPLRPSLGYEGVGSAAVLVDEDVSFLLEAGSSVAGGVGGVFVERERFGGFGALAASPRLHHVALHQGVARALADVFEGLGSASVRGSQLPDALVSDHRAGTLDFVVQPVVVFVIGFQFIQ